MEWKLELVAVPVSDVDRAKAFYTERVGFVAGQAAEYGKPDHPKAWADLAHVLFNAKEFIFVE